MILLSVGLAGLAAVGDLQDVDLRFRPVALVCAVLAYSIFLLANGELWRRVLRAMGPELDPRRSMAIWFTSGLGRFVPTSLLLPVLRAAMCEREGVAKRVCLASLAYETALYFTAALALSAYFVIDLPALEDSPQRYLVVVLPAVALIVLQPRIFHTVADAVLERLGREKLPLSVPGAKVFAFVGAYAVANLFGGLSLYALATCVYPVGPPDIVTVVGAFAVGIALSVLAFVLPGGLIAREAATALALSPVMPAGPAVAVAVLVRIVELGLVVLFAIVTPIVARRPRRERGRTSSGSDDGGDRAPASPPGSGSRPRESHRR